MNLLSVHGNECTNIFIIVIFWFGIRLKIDQEIYLQYEKEKDKYNQSVIDILTSFHSLPLSLKQVMRWHQNATESTKDWRKK